MLTLAIGTNYLRTLVTDSVGAHLDDAVVRLTISKKYGAVLSGLDNVLMTFVPGQSAYNYEFVVSSNFNQPLGILYEASVVATRGGQSRTKTFVLDVESS